MIILGVDPGLTRCGVGVIEAGAYRRLCFIHVDVVRSARGCVPGSASAGHLQWSGREEWIGSRRMPCPLFERVFAQANRNTVLGTAQAAGLADAGRCTAWHPRGVAHADRGEAGDHRRRSSAREDSRWNVWSPVSLGLNTLPTPADAADALAIGDLPCACGRAGALQGG